MDGAKGIGIVASNGNHILDYKGVNRINHPLPPMIFIPTTAGTSADVSQFAIINDSENQVKIAVVSKIIIPDVALIDPETTLTMDNYLTACTGMDALVHAMEAYVSIARSPLTDTHALEAVRILSSHLRDVIARPDDLAIREQIMFGSLEAGLAFSNALLGNVHAMAHSLGGLLDLPHGECNSLLLEHVMNYNFSTSEERYAAIARSCGLETERRTPGEIRNLLFGYIRNLRYDLGIKKSLSDCGVKTTDIPLLAAKAYEDACLITNPRKSNRRDLETIYEEAY
ncbi:MAG: iron-containing alcohol dehydrogenase [Spirochaetales bacterium]|nr:iron-containing alcohol dehydrogenase [Spirochaetales bacterium]